MIELLKKVYSGKKVFLTGHTGFKGSWLLKIFSLLNAEVKGYSLAPETTDDLYNLIKGNEICQSVIADIRDKDRLVSEIESFQPDFIFHLAAQPLVRLSFEIPSDTFAINAIGTANLLDGLKRVKKECTAVLITTDKVYHNNEWEYPYREDDKLGGYDPYSASKACAELIINSYRNSFFNVGSFDMHKKGIAVGRAGNVIGGGDWSKDRLIPDIARALGHNETLQVRNPKAIRPWQHVLEPLVGYLLLGKSLRENPIRFSEPFNFGPYSDDSLTVEEMVKLAIKGWGSGDFECPFLSDQPHEAGLLRLDISKTASKLNWRPVLEASEAVKFTIDWYKEFYNSPAGISSFTRDQIFNFFNRMN